MHFNDVHKLQDLRIISVPKWVEVTEQFGILYSEKSDNL